MEPDMPYQKIVPILERAGICVSQEGEKLLHITRQTIYQWDRGTPPKNEFQRKVADAVLDRVKRATELKLLPLDVGIKDKKERWAKITAALQEASKP